VKPRPYKESRRQDCWPATWLSLTTLRGWPEAEHSVVAALARLTIVTLAITLAVEAVTDLILIPLPPYMDSGD